MQQQIYEKDDDHGSGPDTTVTTSTEGNLMEATSSDSNLHQNLVNADEKTSTKNCKDSPENDYQQPTSSTYVENSPSKSQISDEHTMDSESTISMSTNKKTNAHFCEFFDQTKGQCKQRAINNFKYCIRHILLDPNAPYKQCQHQRKPKNKNERSLLCTNAIRSSCPEIYCSTHLIMNGLKDPKVSTKKEPKASKTSNQNKTQNGESERAHSQLIPIPTSSQISMDSYMDHFSPQSDIFQYPEHGASRHSLLSGDSSKLELQHLTPKTPLSSSVKNKDNWDLLRQNVPNEFLHSPMVGQQEYQQSHSSSKDLFPFKKSFGGQPTSIPSKNHPQANSSPVRKTELLNACQQCVPPLFSSSHASSEAMTLVRDPIKNSISTNTLAISTRYIAKNNYMNSEDASVIPRAITTHKEFFQPILNYLTPSLTFLNNNPPPRRYDLDKLERSVISNGLSGDLVMDYNREAETVENTQNAAFSRKRQQKVIKLRQKRQKIRIDGSFRSIPMVDSMCRIVESQDFDRTDLFPLGLEPSDDESSDDSFLSVGEGSVCHPPFAHPSFSRLELYLLKKQLRLESSRLVQRAKLCVPINTAARSYKNSVGAALRVRKMNRKRENPIGDEQQSRLTRCVFASQQQVVKETKFEFVSVQCTNASLPWARHCSEHITCNISQQLFTRCKWKLCNASVSITEMVLFDGHCRHHYYEQRRRMEQEQYGREAQHTTQNAMHLGFPLKKLPQDEGQRYEHCQVYDTLSSSAPYGGPFEGNSSIHFGPQNREEHLNEPMDVSLASVAKDLGFDGRELTDMLAKLPVEEGFEGDMDPDEDNLLTDMNKDDSDEAIPGVALGHSWADVEQFLLEQEEGHIYLPTHANLDLQR